MYDVCKFDFHQAKVRELPTSLRDYHNRTYSSLIGSKNSFKKLDIDK